MNVSSFILHVAMRKQSHINKTFQGYISRTFFTYVLIYPILNTAFQASSDRCVLEILLLILYILAAFGSLTLS